MAQVRYVVVLARRVIRYEHSLEDHMHLHHLRSVSRLRRLAHPKTRRHMAGMVLGVLMMAVGSGIATHAGEILVYVHVPHFSLDMLAYFIHGIGCIPFARSIEPLWDIFSG